MRNTKPASDQGLANEQYKPIGFPVENGGSMTAKEIASKAFMYLDEKKAMDIKVIDISKISVIADYFIITGGSNERQVKAIADNVEEKLGKEGVVPRSVEGYQNARWILMDYGDVIIHIFNEEDRLFYDLEKIWMDGQAVEIADPME